MIETKIYFSFENNKQLNNIIDFCKVGIKNFNVDYRIGFWNSKQEKSSVIEIINDDSMFLKAKLEHLVGFIKLEAKQESVLITKKELFYSELL